MITMKSAIKAAVRFCFIPLLLSGCKKEEPMILRVTALFADGTPIDDETFGLLPAISDPVLTFADGETIQENTSDAGVIDFTLDARKIYALFLGHGCSRCGYFENESATYLKTGIFKSEEEIANHPAQTPKAEIGDAVHADINGDGIIDRYDLVIPVDAGKTRELTIHITRREP